MKRQELTDLLNNIGRETIRTINNSREVFYKIAKFDNVKYYKQNKAIYSIQKDNNILLYRVPAYANARYN